MSVLGTEGFTADPAKFPPLFVFLQRRRRTVFAGQLEPNRAEGARRIPEAEID